jgi:hypothetical protein
MCHGSSQYSDTFCGRAYNRPQQFLYTQSPIYYSILFLYSGLYTCSLNVWGQILINCEYVELGSASTSSRCTTCAPPPINRWRRGWWYPQLWRKNLPPNCWESDRHAARRQSQCAVLWLRSGIVRLSWVKHLLVVWCELCTEASVSDRDGLLWVNWAIICFSKALFHVDTCLINYVYMIS